jgi:four helix bundle protein
MIGQIRIERYQLVAKTKKQLAATPGLRPNSEEARELKRKAKADLTYRKYLVRARLKLEDMQEKHRRIRECMENYRPDQLIQDSVAAPLLRMINQVKGRPGRQLDNAETQLADSLLSVLANYLEGRGRLEEVGQGNMFLVYARGSLYESYAWMEYLGLHELQPPLLEVLEHIDGFLQKFHTDKIETLEKELRNEQKEHKIT